ncbi:MAG: D-alanine--D-alanine ligase [Chitinivibrionia bacterium]|nr:D-alanine--D-alanine ligase [Chitinivibrionia bacterium]
MKKIAVIMGGPSAEHEISLKTGFQIVNNLDRKKYDVSAIVVSVDKKFFFAKNTEELSANDIENFENSPLFDSGRSPCDCASLWEGTDLAFLALHGEFGEDGVIQGYLQTLGIKHTGCGVVSSAIGMHKILAKKVFESSGIPTPSYSVFRKGDGDNKIREILARYSFPLFVKAPQSGSSKLMYRVKTEEELRQAIEKLKDECKSILVEAGIKGDEFSCPVLEKDGVPAALTPIYIKPKNAEGYFDYNAKYLGESEEICPPPHDKETIDLVKRVAVAVHTALECDGYSRTDIIVSNECAFVLEVNTLPGMTSASLFPLAFSVDGGNFSGLLDRIIENA